MSALEPVPLISVIICTRNRPQDIALCLPTVLANAYPNFEVILIDQSTNDQTETQAVHFCEAGQKLHYIRTPTVGKTRALNIGLSKARGEILAFTDDDCEAPKDWLLRIGNEFQTDDRIDVMFGPVLPSPALAELKDVCVPSWAFSEKRDLRKGEVCGMGANMALRSRTLSLIAGANAFDTILGPGAPFPAGEEGDFVYRLRRAGAIAVLRPSLLLYHRAYRTQEHWKSVLYGYGVGDASFYMKHARCGDWWARGMVIKKLLTSFAITIVKTLRRRDNNVTYLKGFWHGIIQSQHFPIDTKARLYQ